MKAKITYRGCFTEAGLCNKFMVRVQDMDETATIQMNGKRDFTLVTTLDYLTLKAFPYIGFHFYISWKTPAQNFKPLPLAVLHAHPNLSKGMLIPFMGLDSNVDAYDTALPQTWLEDFWNFVARQKKDRRDLDQVEYHTITGTTFWCYDRKFAGGQRPISACREVHELLQAFTMSHS